MSIVGHNISCPAVLMLLKKKKKIYGKKHAKTFRVTGTISPNDWWAFRSLPTIPSIIHLNRSEGREGRERQGEKGEVMRWVKERQGTLKRALRGNERPEREGEVNWIESELQKKKHGRSRTIAVSSIAVVCLNAVCVWTSVCGWLCAQHCMHLFCVCV